MAVHKIAITTTVFVKADTLAEAVSRVDEMTLADIAEETDTGDMIGDTVKIASSETVKAEDIEGEMEAIGSDGSFFADELPSHDEDEDDDER